MKKTEIQKKSQKEISESKMDEFKRNKQAIVTLANFRNEKTKKPKQKYISAIPILMKQLDFAILTFSFSLFLCFVFLVDSFRWIESF